MSLSSAAAPAVDRSFTGWRRPGSGFCCWSAATICRARPPTGFADRVRRRRLSGARNLVRRGRRSFHPGLHYYVGGNSKVYGAALFRMRQRDFEDIIHQDGVSPAWPLKYEAFEPYYAQAERLFHVHGQRGEDPNEPPSSGPFPYPPVSHEPRIAVAEREPGGDGLHPFHLPLGICWTRKTASRPRPAFASAATPSTAFPACSTARPMRKSSASIRP